MSADIHAVPMNEPHHTDSRDCECRPQIQRAPEGVFIVAHRAWDEGDARVNAIQSAQVTGSSPVESRA